MYENLRSAMEKYSDPRTTNWFMMSSPLPTVAMSLTYICVVKIIAPRMMGNRKPYDAKGIQLCYNIIHLSINLYLFHEACVNGWLTGYNYRCQPVDFSMTGTPLRIARGCYIYYLSKFTDFFETITFILLKRFDMVNLYHVAHHSIMPFSVWWGVKFLAGGHSTFFGFINTGFHCMIYIYFILVTVFPQTKKFFFWWKTCYPWMQIIQFGVIFLHAMQLLWKNDCNYPMAFVYFIAAHAVLFYVLVNAKMRMDAKINNFKKIDNGRSKMFENRHSEGIFNKSSNGVRKRNISDH
ncbi:CLUMA_CG013409, isoform A [Clunio marinus]|uniref:Elongation of very long chain fatty acids protein n=1 Tax=Clunio marinus TaxID=568069 RepID=A0A1J1INR9_9DIPT|nr:CLUMA_CG013409, isoform A [Clunio marinus]